MPLLEVDDIHTAYGLSQILFGVSFQVEPGEIVALMGRNGVGKTTSLRTVMGLAPRRSGRIAFRGEDISSTRPDRIARAGIAFVPEDRRIFPELSVRDNLEVAARPREAGTGWDLERVCGLFPDLASILSRRGGHLSGGQQQMLTIGRALMTNPTLILLDEPSEGLAPLMVEALFNQVAALKGEGLSIVLAEQNLDFVLGLSDRVAILEKGSVVFSGTARAVRDDEALVKRYLTV